MDPVVVQALHDAFMKGSEDPSYRAVLAKYDQQPAYMNSADYRAFAMQQIVEMERLVTDFGLQ
jgi:tripartite-type tricarboxylate transporter receptor subunit TctC